MKGIKSQEYKGVDDLLSQNFEDLYVYPKQKVAYLKENKQVYKKITNINLDELKQDNLLGNRKARSYSLKYNNRPLRVEKGINGRYCIRKLGKPISFLESIIKRDFVMLNFLSRTLTSQHNNRSLIISGSTSTGKTTFILSLLEFLNQYDSDALKNFYLYKYLSNNKSIQVSKKDVFEQDSESAKKHFLNFFESERKSNEILQAIIKQIKDTQVLDLIESYTNKMVYTIENPIEYFFENNKLLFNQNSIVETEQLASQKRFGKAMKSALRFDPNLLYISEVRNSKEYIELIKALEDSFPIIGTLHSSGVFKAIQKIIEYGKAQDRTENGLKQAITSGIGGFLHFKRYPTKSGDFLTSYELLEFSDNQGLKERFENTEKVIRFKSGGLKANYIGPDGHYYYISHQKSLIYKLFVNYRKTKKVYDIKSFHYDKIKTILETQNIQDMKKAYLQSFNNNRQLRKNLRDFQEAYLKYYKENKTILKV